MGTVFVILFQSCTVMHYELEPSLIFSQQEKQTWFTKILINVLLSWIYKSRMGFFIRTLTGSFLLLFYEGEKVCFLYEDCQQIQVNWLSGLGRARQLIYQTRWVFYYVNIGNSSRIFDEDPLNAATAVCVTVSVYPEPWNHMGILNCLPEIRLSAHLEGCKENGLPQFFDSWLPRCFLKVLPITYRSF